MFTLVFQNRDAQAEQAVISERLHHFTRGVLTVGGDNTGTKTT